ncbi:F-box domain-containing protein [Meloidogyne graminicola]|uniref:F-box domain-containing protein n=1 Tax=Meloidogyne graminicola TaxID=189291 RepID=A0A8S9ZBG6_9BILA|nr:F-box domain-containing protein [Meloidogyne graminicola]
MNHLSIYSNAGTTLISDLIDKKEITNALCNSISTDYNRPEGYKYVGDETIVLNCQSIGSFVIESVLSKSFKRSLMSGKKNFKKDYNYYLTKPELGVVYYPLDEQLLEKWQSAIDKQIPLFLFDNDTCPKGFFVYISFLNKKKNLKFKLPIYPKNIKELQIIRFWLEQLFRCSFQKMIKLLFENNNKNINLYIQDLYSIYFYNSIYKSQFEFIIDHLIITEEMTLNFAFIDNKDEQNNYLLKLLFNCGKRINCILFRELKKFKKILKSLWSAQKLCLILNLDIFIHKWKLTQTGLK